MAYGWLWQSKAVKLFYLKGSCNRTVYLLFKVTTMRFFVHCLFLFVPFLTSAQLYKPYALPNRWALTTEIGGISPVLSINTEYSPIQRKKSFLTIRAGIGYLFTNYSICSLPHALTWNVALNGKRRSCPPIEKRNLLLLELGVGGVYLPGAEGEIVYRWSPIVGVRRYFKYNTRATGFWKIQLTPYLGGQIAPFGGIGLGLLID